MNATISFAVICAVVALASQAFSIYNGHKKNEEEKKREKIDLEKNLLKLDMKLDSVSNQINALVKSNESTALELKSINTSIIKFDESLKGAWRKIDDHETRILNVEKEVINHEQKR